VSYKRAEDSPVCACLMDFDFLYNVSSQWDPQSSSCIPALGASCASALSAARNSDNCDTNNACTVWPDEGPCAGMLVGGPGMNNNLVTTGLHASGSRPVYTMTFLVKISPAFNARDVSDRAWTYALTAPYEGSNATAFQTASERLRIMLLTEPEGSDLFCNRVARAVEIGAKDDSDQGVHQTDTDRQFACLITCSDKQTVFNYYLSRPDIYCSVCRLSANIGLASV
jgi:hypothetical protein